jgi:very-short-patch-repair endonuclease
MHINRTHKIKTQEYTLTYLLDGVPPTCKCGCGKLVKYNTDYPFTFRDYYSGHYAYAHPDIWGNKQDPERLRKGAETFKKRYANGEIKHWSKGKTKETDSRLAEMGMARRKENNPERAAKISKSNKGVKKSKEHIEKWKAKMQEHWSNPEFRERLSKSHIEFIKTNHKHFTSKLEDYFENTFLIPNNVKFEKHYYAPSIKSFYDYYLPEYNIIIETDGDYWHANPKYYANKEKNITQLKNIERDKYKNAWCIENNITLIRFWECDILRNSEFIIDILKQNKIIS